MALITCPECGEQVSDKAKKCVHCGASLVLEEKSFCPECGATITGKVKNCPNCGCPIAKKKKPKNKKKLMIIGVIVVIAVIVACIVGSKASAKHRVESYNQDMGIVLQKMLDSAQSTEECCNLLIKVWDNSINEVRDSETDQYTRPDGYFLSDFNDALVNVQTDKDFSQKVSDIEAAQKEVSQMMQELKNPPEEYTDAYKAVNSVYNSYIEFTQLIINPSGSYNSYTDDYYDIKSDLLERITKVEAYVN